MSEIILERWANPAWRDRKITVPDGAGPAAPGDQEVWDLAGDWASWPWPGHASAEILRVYDPDLPGEIIRVIAQPFGPPPLPGGQIRVVRGDQGTTPEPHPAGFEIANITSPAGLGARARGIRSGNGLVVRSAVTPGGPFTDTTLRPACRLAIPGGEAQPGAFYEAIASGHTVPQNNTNQLRIEIRWDGVANIGGFSAAPGAGQAPNPTAGCRFWAWAVVSCHSGVMFAQLEVHLRSNNAATQAATRDNLARVFLWGANGSFTLNASAPADFGIWLGNLTAGMNTQLYAGRAWRSA